MKYYNAIDIGRVVAAILVICIHTNPLFHISESGNYFIVSVIARLAVPFFFIVSGFFFGRKMDPMHSFSKDLSPLIQVIKRLVMIYIMWTVIYLPLQFLAWLRSGESWAFWLSYVQNFMFTGSYYTLWYLTGLIFAMIFSYILFKLLSPKKVLILTLSLFIIGTCMQSYFDMFQNPKLFSTYYDVFITTRNGLFFGSFFVSLGMYMAHSKIKVPQKWSVSLLGLSFLLLTFEVFQVRDLAFSKGSGMWFMLVPTCYFLFKTLQNMDLSNRPIYKYLRPFSFLLYVSHGLFMLLLSRLFHVHSLLYFIIILLLTSILSAGIIVMSRRFSVLRKLY